MPDRLVTVRPPVAAKNVAAQILVLRHAPTLPAVVLRQACELAHQDGDDADATLIALLGRPDVPLSLLTDACARTPQRNPRTRALYVGRPEHTPSRVQQLLAEDDRPEVIADLLEHRAPAAQARAAAIEACTDADRLVQALTTSRVPVDIRARAAVRAWELLPEGPGSRPGSRPVGDRRVGDRQDLCDRLSRTSSRLREAVARTADDPRLLRACLGRITCPQAAARLVEHVLAPALTGDGALAPRTRKEWFRLTMASQQLAVVLAPELREVLARAWETADLSELDRVDPERSPTEVADTIAKLRWCDVADRPWLEVRRDVPLMPDHGVELTTLLTAAFGEDGTCWSVYSMISVDFAGTVAELIASVQAICAAAGS